MRKPLYTTTQIVAKGHELARELGRDPSPWQIHQAFDGRGNLSRVKEIWEARDVEIAQNLPALDVVLPDDIENRTTALIETIRRDMAQIIVDAVANTQAVHNRQIALAERDNQNEINLLRREIDYLTKVLGEREAEINDLSDALSCKKSPKPAAPKPPAKAQPVARKSPRRPSRTAPLVEPKQLDPSIVLPPAPEQGESQ